MNTQINHKKYGWNPPRPRINKLKFNPTFSVASLPASVNLINEMPPVYNQEAQGSCHDKETEVLTENGWKLWQDVNEFDKLASVDVENKNLIFEYPSRIIKMKYEGEMFLVEKNNINFCVTPDHKMVVKEWDTKNKKLSNKYKHVKMKDIGWYAGLPNECYFEGNDSEFTVIKGIPNAKYKKSREDLIIKTETWMKFLGIYIAEGTMLKSYIKKEEKKNNEGSLLVKTSVVSKYKIQIAAFKERERTFVKSILSELGVKSPYIYDRFTIQSQRIFEAMKLIGLFGVKAPFKFIPEFIFKMSYRHRKSFIDGYFAGDGYLTNNTKRSYSTSSKTLATDIQRLLFISGVKSSIIIRGPRNSVLKDGRTICGKHNVHTIGEYSDNLSSLDRKKDVKKINYNDFVYCAEMPSFHTLVTKRNNTILISGNCTSQAISGLCEYLMTKCKVNSFMPSRLFIYWNERFLENTVNQDSGASQDDGMKVVSTDGIPPETEWPYDINQFATKPPDNVFKDATKTKQITPLEVNQNLYDIKSCLAQGFPVVFGFTVYESFESETVATTGICPLPQPGEQVLGGHAVCIVGYYTSGDATNFMVRNSWGPDWGQKGYFSMSSDYILNPDLADDFWTCHVVEE